VQTGSKKINSNIVDINADFIMIRMTLKNSF
jgi:hypothetical protein